MPAVPARSGRAERTGEAHVVDGCAENATARVKPQPLAAVLTDDVQQRRSACDCRVGTLRTDGVAQVWSRRRMGVCRPRAWCRRRWLYSQSQPSSARVRSVEEP
jgi:hypothetical protein